LSDDCANDWLYLYECVLNDGIMFMDVCVIHVLIFYAFKYSRGPLIRLGANMPARAERVLRVGLDQDSGSGSSNSTPSQCGREIFDVILFFGIIDILQDYDISKKLEHAYKSFQVDPTSISAVDPKLYSKRFRDFIHRIFVVDKWNFEENPIFLGGLIQVKAAIQQDARVWMLQIGGVANRPMAGKGLGTLNG
jgi:hypothetical protein